MINYHDFMDGYDHIAKTVIDYGGTIAGSYVFRSFLLAKRTREKIIKRRKNK